MGCWCAAQRRQVMTWDRTPSALVPVHQRCAAYTVMATRNQPCWVFPIQLHALLLAAALLWQSLYTVSATLAFSH